MAEGEGFEPPEPFGPTVFKTAAFDHSAIPPQAPSPSVTDTCRQGAVSIIPIWPEATPDPASLTVRYLNLSVCNWTGAGNRFVITATQSTISISVP